MLGGIHTSILTTTNVFLNLLSSPSEFEYYSRLREEADQVFAMGDDWTNQTSLPKLVYADSAIRESLRRSPVLTKSVLREVVRKDGLDMPNGQHIPTGAWMAVPSVGVHYDERFYPKAQLYDPFRFVPPAVKAPAQIEDGTHSREPDGDLLTTSKPRKHEGLSTASETYLAFGYGRHSWYVCGCSQNLMFLVTDFCKPRSLACSTAAQIITCIHSLSLRLRPPRLSTTQSDIWATYYSPSCERKGEKT